MPAAEIEAALPSFPSGLVTRRREIHDVLADPDAGGPRVTWTKKILVVANVTAMSDELLAALQSRAGAGPTAFTLIVPATTFGGGRTGAHESLRAALARLRAAGLEVGGNVADGDAITAVSEAWDPTRYDEIIISTLPMRMSKWLHVGLPERVGALTGARVTHVVAERRAPQRESAPPRPRNHGTLGPLSVLAWGGRRHDATPAARDVEH